jgi:hypothetical protein
MGAWAALGLIAASAWPGCYGEGLGARLGSARTLAAPVRVQARGVMVASMSTSGLWIVLVVGPGLDRVTSVSASMHRRRVEREERPDVLNSEAESEPGHPPVGHCPPDRFGLSRRPVPRVRDSPKITDSMAYGQRGANLQCRP